MRQPVSGYWKVCCVVGLASHGLVSPPAVGNSWEIQQIGNGEIPSVNGSTITWDNFDALNVELFVYDGNTTKKLTDDLGNWGHNGLNISWSTGGGEIFFYDGMTTTLVTDNAFDAYFVENAGQLISWSTDDSEVFAAKPTSTGWDVQKIGDGDNPGVSGSTITWGDFDGGLFVSDGTSTTKLTDNLVNWGHDGSDISWATGDGEIFFYDGTTTTLVTDNAPDTSSVDNAGRLISWSTDNFEIFAAVPTSTGWDIQQIGEGEIPTVSGSTIRWGNGGELFISDGISTTMLADNASDSGGDGSGVAWSTTDGEIFFYDGVTTALVTDDALEIIEIESSGTLIGWSTGDHEIFAAKLVIPEPGTSVCLVLCGSLFLRRLPSISSPR